MSTITMNEIGSSTTSEENIVPLLLGIDWEIDTPVYKNTSDLIEDLYGDTTNTTNSSIVTNPKLESHSETVPRERKTLREIKDFNTINEFASKLLKDQKSEPTEAQKVTYNKFWDLF